MATICCQIKLESLYNTINHDKTIGIIIVKKDNNLIMEYVSDKRIYETTYFLDNKI